MPKDDDLGPVRWLRRQLGSKTGERPTGSTNIAENKALRDLDEQTVDASTDNQDYMPRKHRSRTGYTSE
jgi:hypothetical protein